MLDIATFGGLRIMHHGAPIGGLASRKAEALLVYLACEPRPHPRDVLADLLWDDRPTERARGNLSVVLSSLRQQVGDYVLIDRQQVAFDTTKPSTLDAAAVAGALSHSMTERVLSPGAIQTLEQALAVYQGEFLHGFNLRNSAPFEQWVLDQQDRWRLRITAVRERLAETYLATRQFAHGIEQVAVILQSDPLHDAAHRMMLELLIATGQRAAALSHYDQYAQRMRNELGIEPDAAVRAVYTQIADRPILTARPIRGLPAPMTAFVGKQHQIAHVMEQLGTDTGRLLTLLGPGGIGKTRLAIEVARRCGERFSDGAAFIALASMTTEADLIGTVADGLGLMQGSGTRHEQVLAFLREREFLLVLDNLEQIVQHAGVLSAWLAAAPRLTILATSRERLQIHGEWCVTVAGLDYPTATQPLDERAGEHFSAIALFLQTVRRVRGDRRDDVAAFAAIGAICRLVGGSPLAIELAASWARSMTVAMILQAIERSCDVLQTSLRDVPARHRSMRAVFDASWALLDTTARIVLARTTVFRGGFTQDAAVAVLCDEHPPLPIVQILTDLLDRSLLRQDTHGRYDLHEFVRQYAAEHLDAATAGRLRARQSTYFAALVAGQAAIIRTMQQPAAMAALACEGANITIAWETAREAHDWQTLGMMIDGLARYDDSRGRFAEGYARFAAAETALQAHAAVGSAGTRADLLREMGMLAERMGCYTDGHACVTRSLALAQHDLKRVAYAQIVGSRIADRQGDFTTALALGNAALATLRPMGDDTGIADALHAIGSAYEGMQAYHDAWHVMRECLAIRQRTGQGRTQALSLNLLGIIAEMRGELGDAQHRYEQSIALFSALGERWAILLPLANLGDVAVTLGDAPTAQEYYRRAMVLAREIGSAPQMMMVMVKAAIALAPHNPRKALELLDAPLHHPATEDTFRSQARALAERLSVGNVDDGDRRT